MNANGDIHIAINVVPTRRKKSQTYLESVFTVLKSFSYKKMESNFQIFISILQSRVVRNTSFHAATSLILYKISSTLLSNGRHRNYSTAIASMSSLCGVLYYSVHPNRIQDTILIPESSSSLAHMSMLIGLYLFLIRLRHYRNTPPQLSSPTQAMRALLSFGILFSILAVAIVAFSTESPILTACSLLLSVTSTAAALNTQCTLTPLTDAATGGEGSWWRKVNSRLALLLLAVVVSSGWALSAVRSGGVAVCVGGVLQIPPTPLSGVLTEISITLLSIVDEVGRQLGPIHR
jgi:hypothetical protein